MNYKPKLSNKIQRLFLAFSLKPRGVYNGLNVWK